MRQPFGFVGPSYTSQSRIADDQQCMNFYPEVVDNPAGNVPSKVVLYPTPGYAQFCALTVARSQFTAIDSNITTGNNNDVSSATVGPLTPLQVNEYAWISITSGIISSIPGFAAVGASPNSFIKAFTGTTPLSCTVNFTSPTNWAAVYMSLFTNGSAPAVFNSNRETASFFGGPGLANTVLTWTNPTTAGKQIILLVTNLGEVNWSPGTVTDNGGGTYTLLGSLEVVKVGERRSIEVFGCSNSSGATTVTYHPAAALVTSGATVEVMELTNLVAGPNIVASPIRGEISINGRTFVVGGSGLFEIFGNGTFNFLGTVANDSRVVTLASSSSQVLIASAGFVYVFNLITNAFIQVPPVTFAGLISEVGYCAGFFIALQANSGTWYASNPNDATTWPPLSQTTVTVFPDNVVGMLVDHNEVWFWGGNKSQVYYLSGAFPFPFDTVPGGIIEQGMAARLSAVRLDNTVFWIGGDERGNAVGWRAQGYVPTRVTTHAVEFAWQSYSTVADAVAFPYQDQGHMFWLIYFPTANKTWIYDVTAGMWHERGYFLTNIGQFEAERYWVHTFNFNTHLVGDWQSNIVYQLQIPSSNGSGGWNFVTANGNPIVRVRRSPHINNAHKMNFFSELEVFLETGLGPSPPLVDGAGKPRGPQVMLRKSKNGGKTWSNQFSASAGQIGQNDDDIRVRFLRLGRGRDVVFEVTCSDPIPWRIVDSYIDVEAGDGN